jgi:hypothetical protein
MKKNLFLICLFLISLYAEAQVTDQCDPSSPQERQILEIPNGAPVEALICHQGDDVLVLTEKPTKHTHLIHAGVNLGMPWLLGAGVTYTKLKSGRQDYHVSVNLDGSLGGNGISTVYGKHPFGNSFYVGGAMRGYKTLPGEGGFQMGPTVGLSGGKGVITGYVGLSFLGTYDSRAGMKAEPDISMGIRIRLFRK